MTKDEERNRDVDWSRDRYGNHVESTQRYYQYRKDNLLDFQPIDGEAADGYTRRIANMLQKWENINTEAHIYGRKMWHTHKNPSGCWLCDGITILWMLYETYNMVCQSLPDNGRFHTFQHKDGKLTLVQTVK